MDEWTGLVIGKMHINRITQDELAKHIGIRRDYLNKILNGKKSPKNIEQRVMNAVDEIISERN